jgi:hypothetical protein
MLSDSADNFTFCRILVKVDICMSRTCVCHVLRKSHLGQIDLNCHCFSEMKTRSFNLHRRLINEIMALLDTS